MGKFNKSLVYVMSSFPNIDGGTKKAAYSGGGILTILIIKLEVTQG